MNLRDLRKKRRDGTATPWFWLSATLLVSFSHACLAQQAAAIPPTVASISFSPAAIQSGGTSTMSIALGNSNATAATLQNALVDNLPPGLTVSGATIGGSCPGGAVTARPGTALVSYAAAATIPANIGCSFSVTVTATSATQATYTNTIPAGALQTDLGNSPTAASATLTVQTGVTIPNVTGLPQSAAAAQLAAAGFTVTVTQQYSATVAGGRVITTQPAPGTAQPRASSVRMLVSQGPGSAANTPLSGVPGLTAEQISVARGLEQTCTALATASTAGTALNVKQQDLLSKCSALISDYSGGTNVPDLQRALNAVSGRQATATARVPMQFAAGQIANVTDRLSAVRAGAQGLSFSGLDLPIPGEAQEVLRPLLGLFDSLFGKHPLGGSAGDDSGLFGDRLGVFVTGTLRRGSEATSDAESGFDFKNTGLTVGADYRLGDSYVVGIAGGYGKSETDFDDSGGRLDAKHSSVSLYGSYFTDRFHVDALAGFGHNSYQLGRDISYDSSSVSVGCDGVSCSTSTSGSTGAREYTLSTSSGLDFHVAAFAFGPTLELEYKQVRVSGFTESGPSGLDLMLGSITSDSLLAKTGGYASYAFKTSWAVILPQVRLRYLHEFLNDARTQSVQFAADTLPGASDRAFSVYTDHTSRNYLDWRASVLFQFPHGIAGFIDYGGIAGLQDISVHELNIGLRVETGGL
jgi:uncharacterized protein YhjY with autotransporter beta-barrel domain